MVLSPKSRKSHAWRAALLTGCAIALGLACGSATRTARPPGDGADEIDDADGLLGRGSRDPTQVFGGSRYGDSYGAVGASLKGGHRYGNLFGGTLYGHYKIDSSAFSPRAGTPTPASRYAAVTIASSGTLEGTVHWRRPPSLQKTLPTVSGACGGSIANRSLSIDRAGRVQGAVVYLEKIIAGRALLKGMARPNSLGRMPVQLGGTVLVRGCHMWPRVQIVAPVGGVLRVSRRGDGIRDLTVTPLDSKRPARTLRLLGEGMRRTIHLDGYGRYELSPRPEVPTRAWVFVPDNPYAVVTGTDGRFRLGQVPPGRYTLAVWHPPVITGVDADGNPILRPAVTRRKDVVVKAGKITAARLTLD